MPDIDATAPPPPEMADLATKIMEAAVVFDLDQVKGLYEDFHAKFGDEGIYGLCCAIAHMVGDRLGFTEDPEDGFFCTFDVALPDGTQINPEDLRGQEHVVAGARFATAALNNDEATMQALFAVDVDRRTRRTLAGLVWLLGEVFRTPHDGSGR